MADDLNAIIAGCRRGEIGARRDLYERFHQSVYRLAARMVGVQEADDVVQDVFLNIFAAIGKFRGQAQFSTWIYRVAINECLRHKRPRPRLIEPLTWHPPSRAVPAERALEQAELLELALAELDERLRAIFLLREVQELSYQEIAQVLDVPPGTVASQLNRARGQLQAFLRRIEQGRTP
jgi:RNA polymerase sigma-70 factor, ECF subfamily